MLIVVITAAVVIAVSMFIALAVLVRNPQSLVYRWLSLFMGAACLWAMAINIHGLIGPDAGLYVMRLSFAAIILVGFSMMRFVGALTEHKNKRLHKIFSALLAVGVLLSFTPFVIERYISYERNGNVIPDRGDGYVIAVAIALVFVIYALFHLGRQMLRVRGARKIQFILIQWGLLLGLVSGITTNVLLPNLIGNTSPSRFAFLAIIIWTTFLIYAVVQHRFLDIKVTVARAVAYIISLTVLGLIYVGGAVLLVNWLSTEYALSGRIVEILYIVETLILAVTFHPLKLKVDQLSNRFFFRHTYDSQQVLDKVSSILVRQAHTSDLLHEVGETLMTSVYPTSVYFVLFENGKISKRVAMGKVQELPEPMLKMIRDSADSTIMVDEIDQDITRLNELFIRHEIALATKLQTHDDTLGIMLVGNKVHGSALTRQDIDLVRIISTELAVAIQNVTRFEEIERFSATLQDRVDDATQKLRRTNEKLKAMDETKDDFISMASHQLRTPLTSIKGYVSMVLDGDMGEINPAQRQALNQALVSSQRMVFLIADLLNLSRLKTGKFVIEPTPTKLSDIIESEVNQLQETAKARDLELVYRKPAHFPVLMLDETKIRQVAMNFMDNAIYYTQSGGHITVELKETEKTIEFTVSDDGIGVPKHEQPHLFNKFYRAGNARKARPDGTGLGLFMAKKVIVAQGGSLIFHSKEGKGSTFGFSFAKAKLMAPPNANPVFHASSHLAVAEKSLKV